MGLPAPPLANPRRRARRARSTIAWSVATLLVLNVGFAAYVQYRPGFRDPLFDAKVKALVVRFAASGEPIQVVVLGSSRTAAAVEPKALEAAVSAETGRPCVAFNMGVQGNGPVSQLVHYRRLRDAGVKPHVVVVELLPSAFAWFLDPARHENRPYDATILRPDRLSRGELDAVCEYGFPIAETREDWWTSLARPESVLRKI